MYKYKANDKTYVLSHFTIDAYNGSWKCDDWEIRKNMVLLISRQCNLWQVWVDIELAWNNWSIKLLNKHLEIGKI